MKMEKGGHIFSIENELEKLKILVPLVEVANFLLIRDKLLIF